MKPGDMPIQQPTIFDMVIMTRRETCATT